MSRKGKPAHDVLGWVTDFDDPVVVSARGHRRVRPPRSAAFRHMRAAAFALVAVLIAIGPALIALLSRPID